MKKEKKKIVFIGSGNLATQLSQALLRTGNEIIQVYSKTMSHAQCLARKLCCEATDYISDVVTDADVYFFSVKDDALPTLIKQLSSRLFAHNSQLFLHTAGSVPMNVFKGNFENYGVFYPMQSFSKTRDVDFKEIPIFVEASDPLSYSRIEALAECVSEKVIPCDSERRKYVHLAAVFACNLTNHCYRLCEQMLIEQNIDFNLFLPLIKETASKVSEMSPRTAQTGPMVRYDKSIMEKQLALIKRPLTKEIYKVMAESIHEDSHF